MQVDGKDAVSKVSRLYDQLKDDEQVQALMLEDTLKNAGALRDELREIEDKVTSWKDFEYERNREHAEKQMATLKNTLGSLIDFHDAMLLVKDEVAESRALTLRNERTARDKYAKCFERGQVPKALCKAIANRLQAVADERRQEPFQHWHLACELTMEGSELGRCVELTRPLAVVYGQGDGFHPTYYHTYLNVVFNDQGKQVRDLLPKACKALIKAQRTHAYKPLDPYRFDANPPVSSSQADASSPGIFFNVVAELPHMMYVQQTATYHPL